MLIATSPSNRNTRSLTNHYVLSRQLMNDCFYRQLTVRSKLRTKLKNKRFRSRSPTAAAADGETPQKRMRRSEEAVTKAGLPHYYGDGRAAGEAAAQTESVYRLKNDSALPPEQAHRLKEACFNTRRASLIRSRDALSDVKDRYPWMFCEDEVSSS